jgi:CheY-like chemotaxis protein
MRYMIVDDNAGMRKMIRQFVCKASDTVLECGDGSDAVSAYPEFNPDYVLMDVEMSPMDGFTATEKIFAVDRRAKIIFLTSYHSSAFKLKAKTMNVTGFVTKENLSDINQLIQR